MNDWVRTKTVKRKRKRKRERESERAHESIYKSRNKNNNKIILRWINDCHSCIRNRIRFLGWLSSMRAFTVSCTHSLTLTLTGFGGGGIAQLVSTAVADAQLLSYKKRPKHVEYVSYFPQIDFSSPPLASFLKVDPFGFEQWWWRWWLWQRRRRRRQQQLHHQRQAIILFQFPSISILESRFLSNTPHRCVLHKFWSQVLCTTQALGLWTQTHTITNVHLPFSSLAKR